MEHRALRSVRRWEWSQPVFPEPLKNMEEAGLIYREASDDDKRKSLVFLTEDGVEKRKIARDVVLNFNQELYKKLS